jgi:hypothetical protein
MPFCPKCGKELGEGFTFCPHCGQRLGVGLIPENTSGQGESATVPEEVKGWSWAGFVLTWIWGVFNGVLISLLCLVPAFGIVWAFVLGVKGNEWAWRYKKWDSVEHFKNAQRPWNVAGIVIFAISMVALAAILPAVLIPIFLWW